ncbi:MAG: hypothetical protein ACJZ2B_08510 [Candidatus Neomarinimicrobiota bacterium]|tara:strand:+ start:8956 stop:10425 length:1470 start_codon:yes stop_codon:yes gene_type:complete
MKGCKYLIIIFLTAFLVGQDGPILPGQKSAIKSLKVNSGYSDDDLDAHLFQSYGKTIDELTRLEGAEVIRAIQAGLVAKKPKKTTSKDLKIASILEPGMKKLFHLRDGTIRNGEILSIDDDLVVLKTASGTFNIPSNQFLSETADITNKKGELFKGIVLGETVEEFIIRTGFGDAIIQKRDIRTMKRYHGGVLDRQYEEKRKFYQGAAQLIHIFMDPTAFPLAGNTFYLSGLSVGYGLTDNFMVTTKFGSNFSGDLNFHPRMRFYHRKSAEREVAATFGFGLHRAFSINSIIAKYSHAISLTNTEDGSLKTLEESSFNAGDVLIDKVDNTLYAETFLVFSSRSVNPTGRGKMGWSAGAKVSNAFMDRSTWLKKEIASADSIYYLDWSEDAKYKVPFRCWLAFEYDLRTNLKFVGSAWIDNGYKVLKLRQTIDDYLGLDNSPSFSLDSPRGNASMIDFDFGMLYAVNDNFRVEIHFQQPYIGFYWEFFEF